MQGWREEIYIGKTKRDLETSIKEHFRNIKNGEIENSAVAAHVWKEKNAQWILLSSIKANIKHELTNCENIIIKNKHLNINRPCGKESTKL